MEPGQCSALLPGNLASWPSLAQICLRARHPNRPQHPRHAIAVVHCCLWICGDPATHVEPGQGGQHTALCRGEAGGGSAVLLLQEGGVACQPVGRGSERLDSVPKGHVVVRPPCYQAARLSACLPALALSHGTRTEMPPCLRRPLYPRRSGRVKLGGAPALIKAMRSRLAVHMRLRASPRGQHPAPAGASPWEAGAAACSWASDSARTTSRCQVAVAASRVAGSTEVVAAAKEGRGALLEVAPCRCDAVPSRLCQQG